MAKGKNNILEIRWYWEDTITVHSEMLQIQDILFTHDLLTTALKDDRYYFC